MNDWIKKKKSKPPDDLGFFFVYIWGRAEYQQFNWSRHPNVLSSESLVLDDSPEVKLSTQDYQSLKIISMKDKIKYFTWLA